ncbi:efflux RND transporter permease subunit [Campylobacter canadensis]|uniref:efflux RND transporter permease subunit n=1 Tax=Campylobacter canadensis TaxID=449520 RepID=UPI001CC9D7DE|nr:efflux RND transporter permease subunit [Campylobacter canadensis]MBZ7997086.1 efflux RND transporter permease subunit [Campylobacter canadensis]MBZ7999888.1 efflux RND transporter permease subunit [Campylobacter canadensis]MBZ8001784.1 efflux RND transporter permease subunit [Campylobacter canadensis]MBZ8004449.1 efflux RND transporter permease subunit [Campylobacter canadensis]
MLKIAINRPITTLMCFISMLLFGWISIFTMPVNLYPSVDIPLIKITTYANADLEYVESQITKKLENAVSSVSQIERINSKSFNNLSIIVVQFKLGKDLEVAANDIREKISKVKLEFSPSVEKVSSDAGSILNIFLQNKTNNISTFMQEVDDDIIPDFQRIDGVGEVKSIGFLKNDIKIELDIDLLNKYHLDALDVSKLIKMQNFKSYLGEFTNNKQEITLKGYFDANTISELEQIRLAPGVFLKDVAQISESIIKKDSSAVFNSKEGVLLEIKKVQNYDTLKAIKNVENKLNSINNKYKDVEFNVVYNKANNITKHIKQVVFDMILGVILIVIIVFLFLKNISATIIASIAIPTSIISSFFLIDLFGYDLNRLTLIALTLAIGIFVDDAIVVIENISKKIHSEKNPLLASYAGAKEIMFSVFSISIVLLCVFIPISYMNSIPGLFFNTLGMSVAFGVIISFLVCIFLIPTISARFLNTNESTFYKNTEPFFEKLEDSYVKILDFVLRKKAISIVFVLILCFGGFLLAPKVGLDFLPMEDDNEVQVLLESQKDLSLNHMQERSLKVLEEIKKNENVEFAYLLVGYDDAKDRKKAKIYVKLKKLEDRKIRQNAVVKELRQTIKAQDMKIKVLELPKFEGAGVDEPVQFVLLGDDIKDLKEASLRAQKVLKELNGVVDVGDDVDALMDVLAININKEKARKLNVNLVSLAQVLQSSFANVKVGSIDASKNSQDIYLSLSEKTNAQVLEKINIKTLDNSFITLDSIADFTLIKDNSSINRLDRQKSIKVTSGVDRLSLDAVKKHLESNIDYILGDKVSYTFTGFIDLLKQTIIGFGVVLALAFLLIYLVLAALYESLIVPLVIMLTMPLAFAGACVGLYLTSHPFSLFVLIALILLFGMVSKNAILLIDVANKLCDEGMPYEQALKIAGKSRIRAILMTTIAMIFAMLPLALSKGSGYEGNSPMAIAIISGLISSTILTLFIIPAIYGAVYKIDRALKRIYKRELI